MTWLVATFIRSTGEPRSHDIAALAVFLAYEGAESISGQAIPIDGDAKVAR